MLSFLKKIIPSPSDKVIKKLKPILHKVNSLEDEMSKLSNQALKDKTEEFRKRIREGEGLYSIMPEAFASVRECSKRVLGKRHYDIQVIAGMIISNFDNEKRIAEMKTGEGKTLVATLPSYLNALSGKGVHVVTVNDYLAQRDAEWMGQIYRAMGLSVGCVTNKSTDSERKEAYLSDITYATNNELGFDFLRDNLKRSKEEMVQRELHYALVDEVDCVLIDEGRTPLIISGFTEEGEGIYIQADKIAASMSNEDYEIDKESNNITMTDEGAAKAEKLARKYKIMQTEEESIFHISNSSVLHRINQALKARYTMKKDVDYIVKDGKAMIVDEFRGRVFEGRRYSEGLHQAVEAKEKIRIEKESQTIASISFQNYFRMYEKIAGMAGTAAQEAKEFKEIYNLEVIEVPTHRPIARIDDADIVFSSSEYKYKSIIKEVEECHKKGQPVLIGTTSIENSEKIAKMLQKKKLKHNVLNAKQHEKEAEIISKAGRVGAVTVATNMAGRGTDIILGGGNEEEYKKVCEAGGLLVIGTERHEARRIDDQLRGRSGRQGDPGRTVFYISTEDDLMKVFGIDKIGERLKKLGWKEDEPVNSKILTSSILKAQKRVEGRNYEIRKNLIKFDDVMQEQRSVVYKIRSKLISREDTAVDIFKNIIDSINYRIAAEKKKPSENCDHIFDMFRSIYCLPLEKYCSYEDIEGAKDILPLIREAAENATSPLLHEENEKGLREALISILDAMWKEHLHALDHLRSGIDLRSYGQQTPLNEYKKEAFQIFEEMLINFENNVVNTTMHLHIKSYEASLAENEVKNENREISRNSLCYCGSNKKFKNCHGKI